MEQRRLGSANRELGGVVRQSLKRGQCRNPEPGAHRIIARRDAPEPDIAAEVTKRTAIIHTEAKQPVTGERLLSLIVDSAADIVRCWCEVEISVGRERDP